jgi:hypothetical protein
MPRIRSVRDEAHGIGANMEVHIISAKPDPLWTMRHKTIKRWMACVLAGFVAAQYTVVTVVIYDVRCTRVRSSACVSSAVSLMNDCIISKAGVFHLAQWVLAVADSNNKSTILSSASRSGSASVTTIYLKGHLRVIGFVVCPCLAAPHQRRG